MTVTATSLKTMFPEFSGKSDSFVNIYLDNAKLSVCSTMFGNKYDLALSYLTAHLMKITDENGREVVSMKVGDLSKTFNNSSYMSGAYETTSYGKQFLAIRKSLVGKRFRPIYGSRVSS